MVCALKTAATATRSLCDEQAPLSRRAFRRDSANSCLELIEIHRLQQVLGEAGAFTFFPVAFHPETTESNSLHGEPFSKSCDHVEACSIKKANVADQQIELKVCPPFKRGSNAVG